MYVFANVMFYLLSSNNIRADKIIYVAFFYFTMLIMGLPVSLATTLPFNLNFLSAEERYALFFTVITSVLPSGQ